MKETDTLPHKMFTYLTKFRDNDISSNVLQNRLSVQGIWGFLILLVITLVSQIPVH